MEEVAINPTTEPPELTQDWGNRLLEGTSRICVHQDLGKGAVTPEETDPDLPGSVQESGGDVGWQWPAAGLGALSVAVPAWDLLKEFAIIFITPRIVSVQFTSVAQSCQTLCNPMNCSTPGLPVHHQLRI